MILFNRKAVVNIAGREFRSPPFSVEFELQFQASGPTALEARLWNPSDETVERSRPSGIVGAQKFPEIRIEAGYGDEIEQVFSGEIYQAHDTWSNTDRILKLKCTDKTGLWANAWVGRTYSDMLASQIIAAMCSAVGLRPERIKPKTDRQYNSFAAGMFSRAMHQICVETGSAFFLSADGGIIVEDPMAKALEIAIDVSTSGGVLTSPPEQKGNLWTAKTLWLPALRRGSRLVMTYGNGEKKEIKVVSGKSVFSSHGSAYTEVQGVAA